jgi:anthranilate phosphoribosyltransferase
MTDDANIRSAIAKLVERQDLTQDEAAACMQEMMSGAATPAQFAAFATALRMKGETVDEIAGMATVMRDHASPVKVDGPLLDTCGTGGDGSGSFNVSTCAAFVAAGAGARVAKHGNRAMSSQCGSADVLEALGAKIDLGPEQVARCIETSGVGFMFAQAFHPAMKHVGPARREIGIRTVFNLLGPVTNPARAQRRVLGVARPELIETVAKALGQLGIEHAVVVHGGGLDEVSISGETQVAELKSGSVKTYAITPEACGLQRHDASTITGGAPAENAKALRSVLEGALGPLRDFTLINAAAGIIAWGAAKDFREGAVIAAKSIDSGAARAKLDGFVAATQAAS